MADIQLLSVVALLEDRPEKGLLRGQVGTVVEILAPGVCEVEFSDDAGRTYAAVALRTDQVMVYITSPAIRRLERMSLDVPLKQRPGAQYEQSERYDPNHEFFHIRKTLGDKLDDVEKLVNSPLHGFVLIRAVLLPSP